jgi:uncharacterized protein
MLTVLTQKTKAPRPSPAGSAQRDWLRARNGCEADENCREAVYKSRIAFLGFTNNAQPPVRQLAANGVSRRLAVSKSGSLQQPHGTGAIADAVIK